MQTKNPSLTLPCMLFLRRLFQTSCLLWLCAGSVNSAEPARTERPLVPGMGQRGSASLAGGAARDPRISRSTRPSSTPWAWTDDGFLPFPSDLYTVSDPTTATGRRVVMPMDLFPPDLLSRIPFDGAGVLRQLNDADGFSPGLPILVSIPAVVLPSALPDQSSAAQWDAPVQLVGLETGRRVPFRFLLMPRTDTERPCTILLIQPTERLQDGKRYAVVFRETLRDAVGALIPPPAGFRDALTRPGKEPVPEWRTQLRSLGQRLSDLGLSPSRLSMAFAFTIASQESFFKPTAFQLARIDLAARAGYYQLKDLRMRRKALAGPGGAVYRGTGTFDALTFIDERGWSRPSGDPISLEFLLQLPERCPSGGCPVAIFGHGLVATRETMFQVADAFASRGIATIGVAAPWHSFPLEPLPVLMQTHKNVELLHGLFLEHSLRTVQLARFVAQSLDHRILLPVPGVPGARGAEGWVHALRADRIFYIGQSMGGICGVAGVALAPEIRAAIFDVAGGSAVDMIFDSWVVQQLRLPTLRFGSLGPWENNRIMALGIYRFNDIDPIGYGPSITVNPRAGWERRPVSQQAGLGDGLVPNWTTDKLAQALGLPTLRSRSVASVRAMEPEGPGLRYYAHTHHWFLAHLELMHPRSSQAAARFLTWSLDTLNEAEALPKTAWGGDHQASPP